MLSYKPNSKSCLLVNATSRIHSLFKMVCQTLNCTLDTSKTLKEAYNRSSFSISSKKPFKIIWIIIPDSNSQDECINLIEHIRSQEEKYKIGATQILCIFKDKISKEMMNLGTFSLIFSDLRLFTYDFYSKSGYDRKTSETSDQSRCLDGIHIKLRLY